MVTKTVIIQNPSGLHARPATLFVQKATSFSCGVSIVKGSKRIDGKSILAVMTLGIAKGDEITLEVHGENEEQALAYLEDILKRGHE